MFSQQNRQREREKTKEWRKRLYFTYKRNPSPTRTIDDNWIVNRILHFVHILHTHQAAQNNVKRDSEYCCSSLGHINGAPGSIPHTHNNFCVCWLIIIIVLWNDSYSTRARKKNIYRKKTISLLFLSLCERRARARVNKYRTTVSLFIVELFRQFALSNLSSLSVWYFVICSLYTLLLCSFFFFELFSSLFRFCHVQHLMFYLF